MRNRIDRVLNEKCGNGKTECICVRWENMTKPVLRDLAMQSTAVNVNNEELVQKCRV